MTWRQFKFAIIEWTILPLGILVLKLLARTYRIDAAGLHELEEALRHEKLLLLTYHGMYIPMLACAMHARKVGRTGVIMTSPSRDGRLLDAAIRGFGMEVVKGSSRSRSVAGAREFIQAMERGLVGVLAVDGPRGPVAEPKPGFAGITRATGSCVYIYTAGADRFRQFRSWDRMFMPLPFSRVTVRVSEYAPDAEGVGQEEAVERLRREMIRVSREAGCPIVKGLEHE